MRLLERLFYTWFLLMLITGEILCLEAHSLGVVVTATAQLHSIKSELRFYGGSNPARGVSEIRDGEDLWQ